MARLVTPRDRGRDDACPECGGEVNVLVVTLFRVKPETTSERQEVRRCKSCTYRDERRL